MKIIYESCVWLVGKYLNIKGCPCELLRCLIANFGYQHS